MTATAAIVELLNRSVPGCEAKLVAPAAGDPWIEVHPEHIVACGTILRDDPACGFNVLSDLTIVDWFALPGKKPAVAEPRFEVVYHLLSITSRETIALKLVTPRPQPGDQPEVPSVTGLWESANWHEREAYDMFGVRFTGHPDLRRILCPEDWVGHPLRKDYEFPLEYHGIRGR
jgi:NADH-quinone oxidoreductase subunit C